MSGDINPLPTPSPAPAAEAPLAPEPLLISDTVAAALAGISRAHLHRLRAAGKVGPAPVRLGRALRFDRTEWIAWIAAKCPDRKTWEAMQAGARRRMRVV
jgi:predicted DNA-binding transcriptional regulator AlpA